MKNLLGFSIDIWKQMAHHMLHGVGFLLNNNVEVKVNEYKLLNIVEWNIN